MASAVDTSDKFNLKYDFYNALVDQPLGTWLNEYPNPNSWQTR